MYMCIGARSQLLPQKKKKTGFENRAAALQKLAGETRSDVDKQSSSCRFCGKIFSHPPARVQHERCCGRATPHAPGFVQHYASSGERYIYLSICLSIYP